MERWINRLMMIGLVLLLSLAAPAVTTEAAIPATTTDQVAFAYDACSVRVLSGNVLNSSGRSAQSVLSFVQVGGLVAAKNTPITDPARLLTRGSDVRNATGNITSEILDDATIFYRAHGGDSGPIGRFLSPSKPLSSAQAISGGALPPGNTAQNVSTLRVQGGVRIQRSTASDAFGQIGGDPQVELLERANITIIKTEPLR